MEDLSHITIKAKIVNYFQQSTICINTDKYSTYIDYYIYLLNIFNIRKCIYIYTYLYMYTYIRILVQHTNVTKTNTWPLVIVQSAFLHDSDFLLRTDQDNFKAVFRASYPVHGPTVSLHFCSASVPRDDFNHQLVFKRSWQTQNTWFSKVFFWQFNLSHLFF